LRLSGRAPNKKVGRNNNSGLDEIPEDRPGIEQRCAENLSRTVDEQNTWSRGHEHRDDEQARERPSESLSGRLRHGRPLPIANTDFANDHSDKKRVRIASINQPNNKRATDWGLASLWGFSNKN